MLNKALTAQVAETLDLANRQAAYLAVYLVKVSLAEHNLARHPLTFDPLEGLMAGSRYWYELHLGHPVHQAINEAGRYLDELPDGTKQYLPAYL